MYSIGRETSIWQSAECNSLQRYAIITYATTIEACMCINYKPPSPEVMVETFSAPVFDDQLWRDQIWQDYIAPIIKGDGDNREASIASYGFIPKQHQGKKRLATMNARIEEVGSKRSYEKFWRAGQLCLVPLMKFYEPNWESGKHIRYSIGMADDSPFAVAGIWRTWEESDGSVIQSFTQLTMNADDHPLMKRFHRSGEEKRSLIIVPQSEWDEWLMCKDPERARTFAKPYPAELMAAAPAPLPPRLKKTEPIFESDQGLLL